jgi:hypothetical protein
MYDTCAGTVAPGQLSEGHFALVTLGKDSDSDSWHVEGHSFETIA